MIKLLERALVSTFPFIEKGKQMPQKPTTLKGPTGLYSVAKYLGGTDKFTLYLCQKQGDDRQLILKIAADVAHNGILDREAFILQMMREKAAQLEEEYSRIREGNAVLNYQLMFPDLSESFVSSEQNMRRVNV